MVARVPLMPRTDADRSSALRLLPSVDQLLRLEGLQSLPRAVLTRVARALVDELRQGVLDGVIDAEQMKQRCAEQALVASVTEHCANAARRRHERVYNATGIVLHTGIGRAPISPVAVQAIADAAGYSIVEVDPTSGLRDQREL
ncbi:unnamed protein product, partial [Discosporangium mesarthrocarpum]